MKTTTKIKFRNAVKHFDKWLAGITVASILTSITLGLYWYVNNKNLVPEDNARGIVAFMPAALQLLIYGTVYLTAFAIIAAIVIHAFILKSGYFKWSEVDQQWWNWYITSTNFDSDSSETR